MPTHAEMIDNVQGFWPRMQMRLRLLLMGRHRRPWKMDDILAIFSWVSVGTSFFVLAGTTTAVSLVVAAANSIRVQEYIAEKISEYLGKETGFEITFESAIVPRWREGTIQLKNVSVVCTGDTWSERVAFERKEKGLPPLKDDEIDLNWTYWDLNIGSVDVTLSLWRWLEGRGLIKECIMKGVRGVIDRRHITWDPDWVPTRRRPLPGDFEMDSFSVDDLLLTVLNPDFRPYTVSVFNAELPLFRKQWLLYDILCADSITGVIDNCLFSVHRPQEEHFMIEGQKKRKGLYDALKSDEGKKQRWAKMSHLKINGVPIDHLNAGVTGPFGWITSGTLDIDYHLVIPETQDEDIVEKIRDEISEWKFPALGTLEDMLQRQAEECEPKKQSTIIPSIKKHLYLTRAYPTQLPKPYTSQQPRHYNTRYTFAGPRREFHPPPAPEAGPPSVFMHCSVTLNDLKASVPLTTPYISYMNNALVRPIVAYMNAHKTRIPLAFEAKMDLANFDGAWTLHSAGLVDLIGEEIGRAMTESVLNERERTRQLKRVGLWSLQSVTKNLVNAVDYARGAKGYENWMNFGSPWYA
ncbi:Mitochondrial distribution and morphology protein 31, mitochondrial precursor [Chytridiales sp. JEL 0842]|nr:Mitochondrial distribution and morphology protein 31, mitochondrial precursor [Chytridiales sp. JEL 0842]